MLAALGAIVFFSLLPGYWQERTGLPPQLEHVIAYFGTAGLMNVVWPGPKRAVRYVVILTCLSASMEYLQNFSPGRDPRIDIFEVIRCPDDRTVPSGVAPQPVSARKPLDISSSVKPAMPGWAAKQTICSYICFARGRFASGG